MVFGVEELEAEMMTVKRVGGLVSAGFLCLVLSASAAATKSYRVADGTKVSFVCYGEKVVKPAKGRFATVSAALAVDPADLSSARGDVGVALASITTDDATWDVLFRAAPFLELDEHPMSNFVLEKVEGAESLPPGKWTALTLVGKLSFAGEVRDLRVSAKARFEPAQAEGSARDMIHLQGKFKIPFAEYAVWLPSGAAERFGGTGAAVDLLLALEAR